MKYAVCFILITIMFATSSCSTAWKSVCYQQGAPLEIRVVDQGTGAPIEEFSIKYCFSSSIGKEYSDWPGLKTVESDDGSIVIDAPLSCKITLNIDALDYICYGSGYETHNFDVKTSDTNRAFTVCLKRGLTVEGVVIDEDTGQPIAGAEVAPLVEYHPGTRPNIYRMVKSDGNGCFLVHAAQNRLGISVAHIQYGTHQYYGAEKWDIVDGNPLRRSVSIKVKKGKKLTGTVRLTDGTPVAGAKVLFTDRYETIKDRNVKTDEKGCFEVYNAVGEIEVKKPGFIRTEVKVSKETQQLDIVIRPVYRLKGKVVDQNGEAVTDFTVVTRDGRFCGDYSAKKLKVNDKEGRFEFEVSQPITNLVAVYADGFALTHAPVILKHPSELFTVVMQKGTSVTGKLDIPNSYTGEVEVVFSPQREGLFWRNYIGGPAWVTDLPVASEVTGGKTAIDLATRTVVIGESDEYSFGNVMPGSYTLSVQGKGLYPELRTVKISENGRKIPDLKMTEQEFGVVSGHVYRPWGCSSCTTGGVCGLPEPWPFAEGRVFHAGLIDKNDALRFKTDENGFYCVSNIPSGPVSTSVKHSITFDVIGTLFGTGIVHSGVESVIDLRLEKNQTPIDDIRVKAEVHFKVGDGSEGDFRLGAGGRPVPTNSREPHWTFEYARLIDGEKADRESVTAILAYTNCTFVITNFFAGDVSLRLDEGMKEGWLKKFWYWNSQGSVSVESGKNFSPVLDLPANSIYGRVEGPGKIRFSNVYVVDESSGELIRKVRPASTGGFVVRFVPRGVYSLVVYGKYIGWCIKRGVAVNGLCDVGTFTLKPGCRVYAQLMGDWVLPRSERDFEVKMMNIDSGIVLNEFLDSGKNGGTLKHDNIWPGMWRLELFSEKVRLFSREFDVRLGSPHFVDMEWSGLDTKN